MMIPILFTVISLYATLQGIDVYNALLQGANKGLKLMSKILPTLIILLTAISMLRASGALDALALLLAPLLSFLGIPHEVAPLLFLRPFSGSAAIAITADLLQTHGADSLVGRTASVMLGSTETTFYTMAVYFGATSIRNTRYTLPAALCADAFSFLMASWVVALLF